MKWKYTLVTQSKSAGIIQGSYYGTFAGAIEQVAQAVKDEGWAKNTANVKIDIEQVKNASDN